MSEFVCRVADADGRVFSPVEAANTLDEARVFSRYESTATVKREKSGNLPVVLNYYIAYQVVSTGVKKKIADTLVYPVLLITVAIIIVSYLVTGVVPRFALLYRDMTVELPTPTRVLIAVTVDYRFLFLGFVALLALIAMGVFLWSRTDEGGTALDRFKFRLPLVGDTLLKFQVAQFSRTLSTL